jgi:hypothetical protein
LEEVLKRRDFLKGAAVAAAGASAAGGVSLLSEKEARAAFGDVPDGGDKAMIPVESRAESILEIFLYGGVSQYESFYCVTDYGKDAGEGWYSFLNTGELNAAVKSCGWTGSLLQPFANDANGKLVNFGPYVRPLRDRADVMDRVRVSITKHDLEPHEGAIPLALAGRNLGHPALAGLGSHIQRYFLDRNKDPGRAPFSYVLRSSSIDSIPTDNIRSAIAIGMHPGAARPLSLKIDAAGDLTSLLSRPAVGASRAQYDALMQNYMNQYYGRMKWKGTGNPLRNARVGDLAAAANSIAHTDAISAVLDSKYFANIPGSACGDSDPTDPMKMNLNLAAHLITHPTAPAKYVCIIDGGLEPADGGGGYDTHFENSHTQSRNLSNTLTHLMNVINKPGENDPSKLDLDKTMIVLTTEFGRTPYKQGDQGRNHWPYGFPIVFIGGPVKKANSGVFGACGPDAKATLFSSPTENRLAALMALGIWPFAQESYNVSDVPNATTEIEAATLVKQRQLGYT